jgi:integral membrane protein
MNFLHTLRLMSRIEGTSTLLLFFVAMPLKYFAGMPRAVTVVGAIHGMLFLTVVWMFYQAIERVPLPRKLAMLGMLAAVVPFGPFILDRRLAAVERAAA